MIFVATYLCSQRSLYSLPCKNGKPYSHRLKDLTAALVTPLKLKGSPRSGNGNAIAATFLWAYRRLL